MSRTIAPEITTRSFWLLCILGFSIRILLIITTIGTTDVIFKIVWVDLVKRFGIPGAYAHNVLLNHPPLSLAIMRAEDAIGTLLGVAYTDIFRGVQVAADALTAWSLYAIGSRSSVAHGRWLALFVVLSPAAAFISGFHCNTDPLMVAFTALAAALTHPTSRRPVHAGGALALATGIKVLPLLLVPFFLLDLDRRQRAAFLLAFAAVSGVIFVPAIFIGGPVVARNIFGYSGMDHDWGFPGIGLLLARSSDHALRYAGALFAAVAMKAGSYLVFGIEILLVAIAVRHRAEPSAVLAMAPALFLATLFVAPGFGVQYLDWPIAFLPFVFSRPWAIGMNAAISLFLFITYTVWNGGWPWWYADIAAPRSAWWVVAAASYVLWIMIGVSAAIAIRRAWRSVAVTE